MCGKWRSSRFLAIVVAGELAQRGHVLVENRIRSLKRSKVADVEWIRNLAVEFGGDRVVADVAGGPVILRQGIQARG